MKKGSASVAFIIPMIVLTLAIVGVFGYKLYSDQSSTRAKASEIPLEAPVFKETVTKPKQGLGSIKSPTKIPTPTVASPSATTTAGPTKKTVQGDLENQLLTTEDDGGATELNDLKNQAAGL